MSLMIVTRNICHILHQEHGVAVIRVYIVSFMTSLDMASLLSSSFFMMQKKKVKWCTALLWC